ncbi:MAG: type IX secretion system outer membrane channel protein PorV [Paludibacteraceae bacterium]|nr:type IX secretion system outer membrane channel protein PorV [Paludibacteraceae bacterium]
MKNKIFIAIALLISIPNIMWAQDEDITEETIQTFTPITTGVSFLTVAPDARGGGLGDVGAATAPDPDAQYWNPAKYAFISAEGGATVSYVPWLRKLVSDIDLVSASGYYKIKDVQTVAASFRFFSLGNVLIQKEPGDQGLNVKPYDLAVDVSYSRILTKNFSMGVALRFIWSDLTGGYSADGEYVEPGWSIAADISGYYGQKVPFDWGTGFGAFGFNISNIGKKVEYGDYRSAAFLPTNLRLGGSFTMPIDQYNHISLNVDLNKLLVPSRPIYNADIETEEEYQARLDEYYNMDPITGIGRSFIDMPDGTPYDFAQQIKKVNFSLGLEYDYNEQFFGRIGYYNESKQMGNRKYVTFGAGFKLNVFSLDVAYLLSVTKNNPLDQTLRFTLGFNMNGLKVLSGTAEEASDWNLGL